MICGLLVVPVVLDHTHVVVTRPDQGNYQRLGLLRLVAQQLKFGSSFKDILGEIREPVDVDEDLPVSSHFESAQEIDASNFRIRILLVALAKEDITKFIKDPSSLDGWSKEMFLAAVEELKFES